MINDNDWMKRVSECCVRDTPSKNDNNLNSIFFITIALSVSVLFLIACFSPSSKQTPTDAMEGVAKKIANGQELNWLDKKVIKEWEHGK